MIYIIHGNLSGTCRPLCKMLGIAVSLLYVQACPSHSLDQAAIVQFNRTEDSVRPPTFEHVKCFVVVKVGKAVDSKLAWPTGGVDDSSKGTCCPQVVLFSPLTGGDIWLIHPALEMALQAY